MQARANGKTLCGQTNGWLKQTRPGQAPVLVMRHCQHAQHTGCAHRTATHHRLVKRQGLSLRVEQHVFAGCGWCALTAIECLHPLALAVQQECATAQAA